MSTIKIKATIWAPEYADLEMTDEAIRAYAEELPEAIGEAYPDAEIGIDLSWQEKQFDGRIKATDEDGYDLDQETAICEDIAERLLDEVGARFAAAGS